MKELLKIRLELAKKTLENKPIKGIEVSGKVISCGALTETLKGITSYSKQKPHKLLHDELHSELGQTLVENKNNNNKTKAKIEVQSR